MRSLKFLGRCAIVLSITAVAISGAFLLDLLRIGYPPQLPPAPTRGVGMYPVIGVPSGYNPHTQEFRVLTREIFRDEETQQYCCEMLLEDTDGHRVTARAWRKTRSFTDVGMDDLVAGDTVSVTQPSHADDFATLYRVKKK